MPNSAAPTWTRADLRKPRALLAAVAAMVLTAGAATFAACNLHEIGHAFTATALGWDVDRVNLCLPVGGSVEYAFVGRWTANLQGYAGGLVAAAFLAGVYLLVFARPMRPLRSSAWWAAGLGLVLPIGPQMTIGLLEGSALPGEDYTVRYASAMPPLVILTLVAVAFAYIWIWRAVWHDS